MQQQQQTLSPQRPALRLVSTKELSREEWLEVRKQGIGASDCAAALGINPYQSRLELWMNKTGRDAHLPKPDPNDINSPVYWGNLLEASVAEAYSHKTGNKVRRVNAVLQHPDADKHWMLANLDFAVVGNDEVQILECKTTGINGAKLWANGVPDYVRCQVQHQLAVTGKQAADVAVLICGQELQVHRIERDDELIEHIIKFEREFWDMVEQDTPPEADGSDSADRALRALYPRDNEDVVDYTDNNELDDDFDMLLEVRHRINHLNAQEAQLKQAIQQAMGKASRAVFNRGEVTWRRSNDSFTLDTKALLEDRPDLIKQYQRTRKGSRRFLVRANNS